MKTVELFAGVGGLALGISKAGFQHEALIEYDKASCEIIRENQRRHLDCVAYWPLIEKDVRKCNYGEYGDNIDLLSAGPPCQPFSYGGKHIGYSDNRNMFPEVLRAVVELRPKAVLIENVKGILRESFASHFSYIYLRLAYPHLTHKKNETWVEHLARLERCHTRGLHRDLTYNVVYQLVNAADFGVPQKRERLFIVAIRSDLCIDWSFPEPTHSRTALLRSQYITGEYLERHNITRRKLSQMPPGNLEELQHADLFDRKPWLTVRDAIADLPDPRRYNIRENIIANHVFIPGARAYKGHTGSLCDAPAKTLKAGVHGVPGGENALQLTDGSVRYFTIRECARLQCFPDNYYFKGPWSSAMRGIGNSVPVTIAHILAKSLYKALSIKPYSGIPEK